MAGTLNNGLAISVQGLHKSYGDFEAVRGIDFEAAYRRQIADGNFTLRGVATRNIDNITKTGIPGNIPFDIVGTNGVPNSLPKWIYRFSATYDTPSYDVTAVARGVSAGKYDATGIECQTSCPLSTTQAPTYDDNSVSGTFYVDLNFTKKIEVDGKHGEIFFNVTNLFDRWPMLLPETGLAANTTYSDLLGRSFRVGVRFDMR